MPRRARAELAGTDPVMSASPLTQEAAEPEHGAMQLVTRIATVLRTLSGSPAGLSLAQIARATGLPRASVQRIVDALAVEQFVTAGETPNGIRLGAAIPKLAAAMYADFRALARPHLERLSRDVRETVVLTALRRRRAISVDHVVSDRPVNLTVEAGTDFPLHATAAGKALLATLSESQLADFFAEPLERYTERTIVSRDALLAELDEIVRLGFACDRGEQGEHEFAVATAVFDAAGRPHSISIIVPETRSRGDKALFVGPLLICRDRIHAAGGKSGLLTAGDPRRGSACS